MPAKATTLQEYTSRGDVAGVRRRLRTDQYTVEDLTQALQAAASQGNTQLCLTLLQSGADPNHPEPNPPGDHLHTTNPSSSRREAPPFTRRQTRSRRHLEGQRSSRGTALHKAIGSGSAECVLLLLSNGAQPNLPDGRGVTGYSLAALRPAYLEVLRAMVRSGGCAVDVREPRRGRTALHCAASTGNVGAIKLLCDTGAAINSRDLQGNTPLMLATNALRLQEQDTAAVQGSSQSHPMGAISLLVSRGANVRLVNRKGVTALLHAVEAREIPAVHLLVTQGALVSSDLLQYACLVLQDVKVAGTLLQGPHMVDATMAAILVSLVGSRPSKWTFANSQEERKAHEMARLVMANIRDVGVFDSMLDADIPRRVLFGCVPPEVADGAQHVMGQYGIVGCALLNGKFGVARMLHQAGFRLANHAELLASPWLQDVVTSQKWLRQTLASPCPLKALARCRIRAMMTRVSLPEGFGALKFLSEGVRGYLALEDLRTTSPYDGIIREDIEILLNERYPDREQSRALHQSLFWIY